MRAAHTYSQQSSCIPPIVHQSMVWVWLGTALVSVVNADGIGTQLLAQGGVHHVYGQWALLYGGAVWDGVMGLWLLLAPSRKAYAVALAGMVAMTVLATVLLPALWWHPLGPLLKNVPIAAILWCGCCANGLGAPHNRGSLQAEGPPERDAV